MHNLTSSKDLDALIDDVGDRPIVMLGEASHGTHEFYTWRTAISKRLIEEKGFQFIAVEGDWPDCYKINRYIKGYTDAGETIKDVLMNFDRWPTWMWANWEVAALAEWMKEYNKSLPQKDMVGFYGLDVYSLWDSMYAIMDYLEKEDPKAAQSVKKAIQCFAPFEEDEQQYARYSLTEHSCRDKVMALLKDIRANTQLFDGDKEAQFSAEQNALIAVNAEKYYTAMMSFDNESWNVRDRHMMETLNRLMKLHGSGAKGIVWEHNTHIGDARATNMKHAGMVNIGQLAREEYGINQVYLAGFGTYEGSVIAGNEWGASMKELPVPKAREGSIEYQLHQEDNADRYLLFNNGNIAAKYNNSIKHRAIGVVYNPGNERLGNYVPSAMAERYDAFIYLEKTTALHPLRLHTNSHKIPDTYPFSY